MFYRRARKQVTKPALRRSVTHNKLGLELRGRRLGYEPLEAAGCCRSTGSAVRAAIGAWPATGAPTRCRPPRTTSRSART